MCDVPSIGDIAKDPLGAVFDPLDIVGRRSGKKAAEAQSNIAKSQEAEQRERRAMAMEFAEATPEELAQLNKSITLNDADIARKEKLLASSDPAIIEAGTQALQLLRGEEAKTLAPLRSNIQKQEQSLRAKLQAQLGPGYENTTAGIQALAAFNEQANNAMTTAQNQTIGQLLGVAQDSSARYGAQSNIANANTIAGLFGNIQGRKINALNSNPITAAGSQFVGDLQNARAQRENVKTAIQIGGIVSGAGGFSGFGGFGGGGAAAVPAGGNQYTLNSGAGINVPSYDI